MKGARCLVLGAVLIVIGSTNGKAGLTIYVPDLNPVLRGSGFQSFPLAIDSKGDVFTVTGTSPSDQLLEVTTSGQVLTINAAVGVDIGTNGKLDFAFGGNLYATSYGGVVQFSPSSGSSSMFYSNGSASGDAGMVFDPTRQILWVSSVGSNTIGLNSSGNVVETIPSFGGYGLALDKSGNLVAMTGNGVIDSANPNTLAVTQIADLSSVLPDANIRSLAIDPNTGNLFFTNQFSGPNHTSIGPLDGLYSINPNGTNLTLVANGFTGQEAFGEAVLGTGRQAFTSVIPITTNCLSFNPYLSRRHLCAVRPALSS